VPETDRPARPFEIELYDFVRLVVAYFALARAIARGRFGKQRDRHHHRK
jgi:hypothetical protein